MKLDDNTFGDSPAAITLVKIINERGLNHRKPARLLNRFNKMISDLNHVDVVTSTHIMKLVYHEFMETCESFENPLNSYTQNVLTAKYRQWQIRKNIRIPKKKRKQ
jgi:hypothetical protein